MAPDATRRSARFYAESFAPWCERARWALDHHGVAYREIGQLPVLAELGLRIAGHRMSGPVTVPLLVDGDTILMNFDAIARHAERAGRGASLFPSEHEQALVEWMAVSETLMVAGRAMLLPRMLDDSQALREQLPSQLPSAVRKHLGWVAAQGVRHLMRKYGVHERELPQHESRSRHALARLRAALGGGRMYLVGSGFTFADITLASALQFIVPVSNRFVALEPATRRAWTHPGLASDHADLLAWRDGLYAMHRGPLGSPAGIGPQA